MGSTKHLPGEAGERSSSGSGSKGGAGAGPRDEDSVVISLSALIAMEEAAIAKAAGARSEPGARGAGGGQGAAGGEQERSSYLDLFPFGAPTELSPFRAPELTPVPSEVPIDLRPMAGGTTAGRRAAVLYGAAGLVGALVIASAVWLGGQRAPSGGAAAQVAQAGVGHAARAALAALPQVEAPPAVAAAAPWARPVDAEGERSKRDAKKARPAASASGGKAAAPKRAAGRREAPSGTAAPKQQQGQGAARATSGDPCNGDLACAMRRATGGS